MHVQHANRENASGAAIAVIVSSGDFPQHGWTGSNPPGMYVCLLCADALRVGACLNCIFACECSQCVHSLRAQFCAHRLGDGTCVCDAVFGDRCT